MRERPSPRQAPPPWSPRNQRAPRRRRRTLRRAVRRGPHLRRSPPRPGSHTRLPPPKRAPTFEEPSPATRASARSVRADRPTRKGGRRSASERASSRQDDGRLEPNLVWWAHASRERFRDSGARPPPAAPRRHASEGPLCAQRRGLRDELRRARHCERRPLRCATSVFGFGRCEAEK
jgi:hypothetical protein